jgi:hypothetical protein|tara:strand:- start:216 stop:1100 length:885 start_codon:yes stop_codon:yes gene_type:complete
MNNGIIMFALNGVAQKSNKDEIYIDYVKMAIANAILIKRYMKNNSVCLLTDKDGKNHLERLGYIQYFDHVIIQNIVYDGIGPNTNPIVNTRAMRVGTETIRLPWQNQSRPDAYRLSPYDKTILLDADYFVFDSTLDSLFDTDYDIVCGAEVGEVAYQDTLIDYYRLHHQTIKMYWATVLYFTKSYEASLLFKIMSMIKKNWAYYGRLYKFESRTYRNDFAVSIALHMLKGKFETKDYDLPYKIMCLADKHTMISNTGIVFKKGDIWAGSSVPQQNMHIMNKESAMQLAERVCNE